MNHRSVFRLSSALLVAFALGCSNEEPTSIPEAQRFEITPLFKGIDPGENQQLTATLGGQAASVSWESSDQTVATVSATGMVTGVKAGFAAITAKLASNPSTMLSSNITVLPLVGTEIANNVARTIASSAARGSTVTYRIFVPTGKTKLTVTLAGGTGDADIYVRRKTPPTLSSYTDASENGGNGEEVVINNPESGWWYIVVGLWDPYANASLMAVVTP